VAADNAAGFAVFTVNLSNKSAFATTFNLALAAGTATTPADYTNTTQVSTDGITWVSAATATIPAGNTFVFVRTPIIQDAINETSENFTLTVTHPTNNAATGFTTNTSVVATGTIVDTNDPPDAIDDVPTSNLQEDTANVSLAGNAILGGSGNIADTDPNSDTLAITGAVAGSGVVAGTVGLGSALTVSGIYGNLVISANGSYTYTLDNSRIQTQNIIGGQTVNDIFTYKITDGKGGFDTATISVAILGTLDITAITPQPVAIVADGLSGTYYGYNDSVQGAASTNRVHADDGLATQLGTTANIESVEDLEFIINGRNVAVGGPNNIVGTGIDAANNAADVRFNVRTLSYGFNPNVLADLGANSNLAAGSGLNVPDGNPSTTTNALGNFLDQDQPTAIVQTGAPVTPVGTQVGTGLGRTTDGIIRMSGNAYLERGNYDFRVVADDGFRLKVGGETLIEFDGNQPPTIRFYSNVEVSDLISGLTSIELLYWEQGGNAKLQFDFKPSSSSVWIPFSLDTIAFFSTANTPVLTDTRIQDIVETGVNQQYELRTGSVLDGDGNINTLTGSTGRDYIQGFGGADTLNGFGSADFLDGGIGNDILNGGDGNDILIGGAGDDAMTGGLGDDIYRVDSLLDTTIEAAGEGTDTIEIDATFNVGSYTILANFENILLQGAFNASVVGNSANNRISGNDGVNVLDGGSGDDRLIGGKGNDTLTGGLGNDNFQWNLADRGTPGAPAIDTVTDFVYSKSAGNNQGYGDSTTVDGLTNVFNPINIRGDSLDLRDLLVGEGSTQVDWTNVANIGNLLNYIDTVVVGSDTVMRISSTGGFTGGTYAAGAEDQRIVFTNVNLFTVGATSANETELLQKLLFNGTLVVD
jgi:VCBS repeat-containing protein